jgi:hypothetical protein
VAAALWVLAAALLLAACERWLPSKRVGGIKELPYPTCPGAAPTEPELLHKGHLRSGPFMRDPNVVERYEVWKRDCHVVATVRQEWPLGTADVEVVFSAALEPLRVWKRMTNPARKDPAAFAEITRFDLRLLPVTMKRRTESGGIDLREIKGEKPSVVFGPGRGLLSLWIQKAHLGVDGKTRAEMLDFRGTPKIGTEVLRRAPDQTVDGLGLVHVYTVFGREAVFTDPDGWVIGDLQGLRPDAVLTNPAPPAIPVFGAVDPRGTP